MSIDRLTVEQEARLAELRTEWEGIGLTARPADRLRAERGLRAAFVAADLPPPSLFIWVRSPLEGVLGMAHLALREQSHLADALEATYLDLIGHPGCELWSRVWAPYLPPPEDALGDFLARAYGSDAGAVTALVDGWVWSDAWRRVEAQVAPAVVERVKTDLAGPVRGSIVDRFWAPVCAQIQAEAWTQLKARLEAWHAWRWPAARTWSVVTDLRRLLRVQDALLSPSRRRATPDRLAAADFFERACGVGSGGGLAGLVETARAAGWWWPHRGAVVVSDRPARIERDDRGRLHAATGPAVEYPDGWAIWAWHGVRVPRRAIERPEAMRAEDVLAEPDVEVRRVMIERLGTDRFLRDAGARRVAEDEAGVLWRLDFADDEPLVCVEVVDATPGRDATFRRYVLRVPPHVQTPREAVAWTFGVDPTDYRPTIET